MINRDFISELHFRASRSSGPGGQHVNKVNTMVELRFNVPDSFILDQDEKALLLEKLKGRLTASGDLIITAQESRSQLQNRKLALEKFYTLIEEALRKAKKRRPTHPTAASRQKRLEAKRRQSEKKARRKW